MWKESKGMRRHQNARDLLKKECKDRKSKRRFEKKDK